jgi:hypothetical protein
MDEEQIKLFLRSDIIVRNQTKTTKLETHKFHSGYKNGTE